MLLVIRTPFVRALFRRDPNSSTGEFLGFEQVAVRLLAPHMQKPEARVKRG
jgi:hypothetical protein